MAKMIKVIPLKSTKLDGELVKGGQPIEVSTSQRDKWIKEGILSDGKPATITVSVDNSDIKIQLDEALAQIEPVVEENESLKIQLDEALEVNKKLEKTLSLKDMTIEEIKAIDGVDFGKLTDKDDLIQAVIDSGVEVLVPDLLGSK